MGRDPEVGPGQEEEKGGRAGGGEGWEERRYP